jgi:hypothetical protein
MSDAIDKLKRSLAKRNKGTFFYKSPFAKMSLEKAKKENRKLTKREREFLEEGHAEKIIEEEAEANYEYLSNPKKRKIVVLDKDPNENKEYLDLKDPTSTEGSFKKGGLVRQGKPKLTKKGWR